MENSPTTHWRWHLTAKNYTVTIRQHIRRITMNDIDQNTECARVCINAVLLC